VAEITLDHALPVIPNPMVRNIPERKAAAFVRSGRQAIGEWEDVRRIREVLRGTDINSSEFVGRDART
jgi:hypothetical protein